MVVVFVSVVVAAEGGSGRNTKKKKEIIEQASKQSTPAIFAMFLPSTSTLHFNIAPPWPQQHPGHGITSNDGLSPP
jgi:hypothetical protein